MSLPGSGLLRELRPELSRSHLASPVGPHVEKMRGPEASALPAPALAEPPHGSGPGSIPWDDACDD